MQVTNFTVTLPGRGAVDGSAYGAAASASTGSGTGSASADAGTASTTTAAMQVVNIAVSDMQVVIATPTTSTGQTAAPLPPPVDLSKIVDTTPPVITLSGDPYISVLQVEKFVDPGATAYDNIDGNSVTVLARLQLCARPSGIETAPDTDSRPLSCGPVLPALNTSLPSRSNETYVFSYSARDAAGNQAILRRRYVVITAR